MSYFQSQLRDWFNVNPESTEEKPKGKGGFAATNPALAAPPLQPPTASPQAAAPDPSQQSSALGLMMGGMPGPVAHRVTGAVNSQNKQAEQEAAQAQKMSQDAMARARQNAGQYTKQFQSKDLEELMARYNYRGR
jgi:hypothetical protein